jgi:hypothetical protein
MMEAVGQWSSAVVFEKECKEGNGQKSNAGRKIQTPPRLDNRDIRYWIKETLRAQLPVRLE